MKKIGFFSLAVLLCISSFPGLAAAGDKPAEDPDVTISATYIPEAMPNTGFPPLASDSIALAAAFLFAAGLAMYPYAKTIITTGR